MNILIKPGTDSYTKLDTQWHLNPDTISLNRQSLEVAVADDHDVDVLAAAPQGI
ncbi:hypothetical protein [Janthinobacterium lividum]|uniref:hypothetical protein n=1 Tax=Janthinobacterium lividum TaxID=29581 RepID=UPI0014076DBB|nr:hypothetical protein [Janthinobacterium lividum]NHQ92378.1 hypothetical protein [Janthinobacterium lividum]